VLLSTEYIRKHPIVNECTSSLGFLNDNTSRFNLLYSSFIDFLSTVTHIDHKQQCIVHTVHQLVQQPRFVFLYSVLEFTSGVGFMFLS